MPQMVKITGQSRKDPNDIPDGCGDDPPWDDFEVHSVVVDETKNSDENGKEGADSADVTFFPCLHDCEDEEACQIGRDEELDLCPSTDAPEHW